MQQFTCLQIYLYIFLFFFRYSSQAEPFHQIIQPEEIWMYKYPYATNEYVPVSLLVILMTVVPLCLFTLILIVTRNVDDYVQAILATSLSIGITVVTVDFIKVMVGKFGSSRNYGGHYNKIRWNKHKQHFFFR